MSIDEEYKKFKDELFVAILQRVEMEGKNVRILEQECLENEGETLCIVWREEDGRHVLYWELPVLYSNFQKEGWEGILHEMAYRLRLYGILKKNMDDETPKLLLRRTEAYEDIILRPLNYDYFRNELKDGLYWRFGDIALVLYRMVYKDAGRNFAEKMNRRMTEQIPDSDNAILTNALFTTYAEMPPALYSEAESVKLSNGKRVRFMNRLKAEAASLGINGEKDGVIGYRLSTVSGTNGAVALFYPGVRQRLAELFGGDYYVGFISVHEAVIYPVRYKRLSAMKAALARGNALCDKKEMLTNNVYRYCRGQNRFVEV